jgi:hypothetical protein
MGGRRADNNPIQTESVQVFDSLRNDFTGYYRMAQMALYFRYRQRQLFKLPAVPAIVAAVNDNSARST